MSLLLPTSKPAGGDRNTFVGGTDMACLLGLSSWGNPMSVWLDKTGRSYPDQDSELLMIGREVEPVITKLYEHRQREQGLCCYEIGPQRHNDHVWAGGSPDRIVCLPNGTASHGLELKNISIYAQRDRGDLSQDATELDNETEKNWGRQGTDEIPIPYLVQVLWYLTVTGLPYWDVAGFFYGSMLKTYRVTPDQTMADVMLDVGGRFWTDHVIGGTPPDIDGSKYTKYFLDRAFTAPEPGVILKADAHTETLLSDYAYHRACITWHGQAKDLLAHRLKNIIGNAEGVQGKAGKATWKYPKESKRKDPERVFRMTDTGDNRHECRRVE